MKKTMEELEEESYQIQAELSKYSCKPVPFEDKKKYMDLRKRLTENAEEQIKMEHEVEEAKKQAFASRPDIKEIRQLLEKAILKMKMPINYSREEMDSCFTLSIKSADNIQCGGYALDDFGKETTLDKISFTDLAGILEWGVEDKN